MKKEEILKIAQREKSDEGRKFINDFALATVGAFAIIGISIMILYNFITNESYGDLLSLLIGMVGAFCYGKFVLNSNKYWLIGAAILLTGAGVMFINTPGL